MDVATPQFVYRMHESVYAQLYSSNVVETKIEYNNNKWVENATIDFKFTKKFKKEKKW